MALVIPKSVGGDADVEVKEAPQPIEKRALSLAIPKTVGGDYEPEVQQEAVQPTQQPEQAKELTTWESVKDFFTGNERATPQTESMPELGSQVSISALAGEGSGAKATAIAAPVLSTVDPEGIVNIVTSNFPHVQAVYNKDAQGNVYPMLVNNENGVIAQVNRPGMSALDVMQGLGLMVAFTPAGRAGRGAMTTGQAATRVGTASAVTQAGLNAAQEAAGRDATAGDIATEIGLAGAGGASFEVLGRVFANLGRAFMDKVRGGRISEDMRQAFIEQATKLGIPVDEITDDYIREAVKMADDARSPNAALTSLENEFDVTLTNSQRAGNQAALSAEDSIRSGLRGQKAQEVFLQGERQQSAQINKAAANLQEQIAGSSDLISTRQQAGAALREGIQTLEKTADEAIEQAYASVGDATLTPEGFRGLLKATRDATKGIEYPKDERLVPAFATLQKEITKAERQLSQLAKQKGARLKPVHIRQIEDVRKAINSYAGAAANPTDSRNLRVMKQAFDDYLDDAVIKGLFDGDASAIESLKAARGVFKEYMQKFSPDIKKTRLGASKDQAGEFVRKIILDNPTDEQVLNSLFTASSFNKAGAAKMAQKYKSLLGEASQEWGMVRQAAFDQLIKRNTVNGQEVISGSRTLKAISDALNQNRSLMNELFTPGEISKLRRFAVLVKKTQPDLVKSRENPSGTAQKALKEMGNILKTVMPFMDNGALTVTTGAGVVFKNRAAKKEAARAFRPFQNVRRSLLGTTAEAGLIGGASNETAARL